MKRQKSAPAATGTRTHGSGVPFAVEAGEGKAYVGHNRPTVPSARWIAASSAR